MASTFYTDFQSPAVNAAWLNDVNAYVYNPAITKIAYVSISGNDSTGIVGNLQKPFRQVNAALTAVATIPGAVVVEVLDGNATNYNPVNTDNKPGSLLRNNLTIRASQRGWFNSNCTGLDAIAIPGPFVIDSSIRKNITWQFLGCDSGKTICDSLYAGVAQEAIVVANLPQGVITGTPSITIDRPISICYDDNVLVHALLVESTNAAVVIDPLTCYGVHGGVCKSTDTIWSGGHHYRHNGECFIAKSDAYAPNDGGQYDDLHLGGSPKNTTPYFTGADLVGLKINPQGADIKNQQFGKVKIKEVSFAVKFELGGAPRLAQNVTFGQTTVTDTASCALLIDGPGTVVHLDMAEVHVYDSVMAAAAVAVGSASNLIGCKIGTLSMLNSGNAIDMSASSQDFTIDTLQVRSILPGTYIYHLGTGRLRIGREEIEPGSLAQKWHPSSAPTYSAGWVTQVTAATVPTVNLVNYGVALSGRAGNTGTSLRILSMPVSLVPGTPDGSLRIIVRGQLTAGGGTPCRVGLVIGISGGLCVVDIETINDVAVANSSTLTWVELSNVRWTF